MSKTRWSRCRDFLTPNSMEERLSEKHHDFRARKKWAWASRNSFNQHRGGWHHRKPDGSWSFECYNTTLTATEGRFYRSLGFTARSCLRSVFVVRLHIALPLDLSDFE